MDIYVKKMYFIFFLFSIMILYIDFTHIAAWTTTDDITN